MEQAPPHANPHGTTGENIAAILSSRLKAFYAHRPGKAPTSEQLHKLRICARHLRYSLEFFRAPFGLVLDETINQIKELQEVLGNIHDLDVLAVAIAELADSGAPAVLRLQAEMERRRSVLLKQFREHWSELTHPEFRQWLNDLLGQVNLSLSSR